MSATETQSPAAAAAAPDVPAPSGRWIEHWEPEDPAFWEDTGKKVARRNLAFSIFACSGVSALPC
jgi:NNP family nitrate/nitrite transporter-like MFS transporter